MQAGEDSSHRPSSFGSGSVAAAVPASLHDRCWGVLSIHGRLPQLSPQAQPQLPLEFERPLDDTRVSFAQRPAGQARPSRRNSAAETWWCRGAVAAGSVKRSTTLQRDKRRELPALSCADSLWRAAAAAVNAAAAADADAAAGDSRAAVQLGLQLSEHGGARGYVERRGRAAWRRRGQRHGCPRATRLSTAVSRQVGRSVAHALQRAAARNMRLGSRRRTNSRTSRVVVGVGGSPSCEIPLSRRAEPPVCTRAEARHTGEMVWRRRTELLGLDAHGGRSLRGVRASCSGELRQQRKHCGHAHKFLRGGGSGGRGLCEGGGGGTGEGGGKGGGREGGGGGLFERPHRDAGKGGGGKGGGGGGLFGVPIGMLERPNRDAGKAGVG
eukprot:357523-Chlamydomonas_euryale.AAC.16